MAPLCMTLAPLGGAMEGVALAATWWVLHLRRTTRPLAPLCGPGGEFAAKPDVLWRMPAKGTEWSRLLVVGSRMPKVVDN